MALSRFHNAVLASFESRLRAEAATDPHGSVRDPILSEILAVAKRELFIVAPRYHGAPQDTPPTSRPSAPPLGSFIASPDVGPTALLASSDNLGTSRWCVVSGQCAATEPVHTHTGNHATRALAIHNATVTLYAGIPAFPHAVRADKEVTHCRVHFSY